MSLASDKKGLLKSLQFYESFLKTIDEDIFQLTPSIGGWSFSEVYGHILGANFMSTIALEKCLNKTAEIKTQKSHWKVRLILFFGKFPFGKIKAPAHIEAAVKKITKEEAANTLIKFRKKLEVLYPTIKNADVHYKIKHPRLGYLDAKSWFRFILIHTKHHQNQIARINKALV
jgi:hypothetical protein